MGEIKLIYKLLIGRRLLQGMEIDPMEVLHDGLFERQAIIYVHLNEDRHEFEFGKHRSSPSSLPRDHLVLIDLTLDRSNDDRLKNAELPHG